MKDKLVAEFFGTFRLVWVAPLVGPVLAGLVYPVIAKDRNS